MTRILGTLLFGRVAMGMGDVDLMMAVGAVLGGGSATAAFFLAPFFGILFSLYLWFLRKKREIPYGPYLSLATAFVMLFYCPIAAYFAPGLSMVGWMLKGLLGAGGA
jgi:leader peptidase (prepilin peptidase)/N-methyltransferase